MLWKSNLALACLYGIDVEFFGILIWPLSVSMELMMLNFLSGDDVVFCVICLSSSNCDSTSSVTEAQGV